MLVNVSVPSLATVTMSSSELEYTNWLVRSVSPALAVAVGAVKPSRTPFTKLKVLPELSPKEVVVEVREEDVDVFL